MPCHSTVAGKNGVGPSLFGAYGRDLGQAPNDKDSEAMPSADRAIDETFLTSYLADPKLTVPGIKEVNAGLEDPAAVATVIT